MPRYSRPLAQHFSAVYLSKSLYTYLVDPFITDISFVPLAAVGSVGIMSVLPVLQLWGLGWFMTAFGLTQECALIAPEPLPEFVPEFF